MPSQYRVSQGDCLASIACARGLDWQTIYNHPDNAELRRVRPNPNQLYPLDEISIPDLDQKQIEKPTDNRHSFVVTAFTTRLRIRLQAQAGEVYADARYLLKIGTDETEGQTDGDGMIDQVIPADTRSAELHAWLQLTPEDPEEEFFWSLALGALDPMETVTGVQARLNNLGFCCGKVDNVVGPRTRAALRAFQSSENLEVTGEVDDATRSKLLAAHDGEQG